MALPVTEKQERPQGERSVADLPLLSGTAFMFAARVFEYLLVAVTGVILARGLGSAGRGVYSLINQAAQMAYAPLGLGLESGGIYLAGRQRYSVQTVFSNAFAWTLVLCLLGGGATALILMFSDSIVGLNRSQLAIAIAGGGLMSITFTTSVFLLAQGRLAAYTVVRVAEPALRLLAIVGALVLVGLTITTAASAWLAAMVVLALISALLLSRQLRLWPGLNTKALWQQVSFGMRNDAGAILQVLNHRLDVFLVSYFAGTSAVGHYTVGFGTAELAWWIPLSLGTVLFPKASAMDAERNAEMSAVACRRALLVTLMVIVGLAAIGKPLIAFLYGSEFDRSLAPFYILLPSGLFYSVHKVLSSSLAAQGVPQASLYGGLASVPLMIGLDLVFIPRMDIVGAALVSDIAYGVNATVMLFLFLRVTGLRLHRVVLPNRSDLTAFLSVWQKAFRVRGGKGAEAYEAGTSE